MRAQHGYARLDAAMVSGSVSRKGGGKPGTPASGPHCGKAIMGRTTLTKRQCVHAMISLQNSSTSSSLRARDQLGAREKPVALFVPGLSIYPRQQAELPLPLYSRKETRIRCRCTVRYRSDLVLLLDMDTAP